MSAAKDRVGELLLKKGKIDDEQLEKSRQYQRDEQVKSVEALVKLNLIDEEELLDFFSRELLYPAVPLDDEIDPDVAKIIPEPIAKKFMAIAHGQSDGTLQVAMADPTDWDAVEALQFRTGHKIQVSATHLSSIKKALDAIYGSGVQQDEMLEGFDDDGIEYGGAESEDIDANDMAKMAEEAPVVKLVNYVLQQAIKRRASDIHIEPYEKSMRVRLRVDGALYELMKPKMNMRNPIVSRIKIMSRLDIAERRLPQDGRIKLKMGKGKDMDFRVSILPTLFGEKVVMRLLDKSNLQLDMTKLGFEEKPLQQFKEAIHKPFGMVLVTGPTGSGKTTTLYSALSELSTPDVNVSTAEDPVEFNLYGINQVQMHEEIGLTFASSLRSFLRQDPDIIMVGEIRDFETAEIGVKAALTGHLVLSTLHTNDAPQTINRLLNMGIEPFLVASSVNLILAQRLARKICANCKREIDPPVEALRDLGVKMEEIGTFPVFEGAGCETCNKTGFKGRVALYEVMPIFDEVKELVLAGASALEIKREAIRLGMNTLRMAGVSKLKEGITTINEIARCTMAD
jgi:type IV pilus assembly protein PilB